MRQSDQSAPVPAPAHPIALRALLEAARALGAVVVESGPGWLLAVPRPTTAAVDVLTEAEAAAVAKVTLRTLRDARRAGELRMGGRQRSRTILRADLEKFIETRRAPVEAGVDDPAMAARVARIERARARKGASR